MVDGPKTGDIAPDFKLESVRNGSFQLSEEVKKGPILLYFYVVNYGKTCTDYIEVMNDRYDELEAMNVRMVHINPDTIDNHEQWMERTESRYDHLSDLDQKISNEYGSIVIRANSDKIIGYTNREFFLIDENMEVRYTWKAYMPNDTIPMTDLIDNVKGALRRS